LIAILTLLKSFLAICLKMAIFDALN